MTWVRPSLRSLFTDTETCPQKVPCSPNGKARDATGEATGDLQSTPLAPAVPRGAEAAAPALADGFQDAGDSASLAPSAFLSAGTKPEEASATASIPPDVGENAPLTPSVPAEALPEASPLAAGPWAESNSLPLQQPLPKETPPATSALAGGPPHQVSNEHAIGTHDERKLLCQLRLGCAGWGQRAAPSRGTPPAMVPSGHPQPFTLCNVSHGGDACSSLFQSAKGTGLTCPPPLVLRLALGHAC